MAKQQKRRRTVAQESAGSTGVSASEPQYTYEVLETPHLPEQERANAAAMLGALGLERLAVVRQLDALDEQLKPFVQQAVRAELPYRRISELTGYSRSTIARWSKDFGSQ